MGRYLRWSVVVVGVGVRWSCRLLWFAVVRLGFSAIYYCRGQWSVALGQPIYLRGSRPQRAAAGLQTNCMSTMSTQQPLQHLFQRSSSRSSQFTAPPWPTA